MKETINIKYLVSNTLRTLWNAALPIILFEIIYKTVIVLLLRPTLNIMFSLFIRLGGYSALVNADIKNFLTSIVGIITILVFMYLAILIVYYEFAVLIIMLDRGFKGEKIKIRNCMEEGLIKLSKVAKSNSLGLAIYMLVLIPFINIGVQSSFLPEINVPEFISGEVLKYTGGEFLIALFVIACILMYAKSFLILPTMVLEEKNFKEARKKSFEKMKGNAFKASIMSIVLTLLWLAIAFIPSILLENTTGVIFSVLKIVSAVSLIVFSILVSPMMLGVMLVSFKPYEDISYTEEAILNRELTLNLLETRVDKLKNKISVKFNSFKKMIKNNKLMTIVTILIIAVLVYFNFPVNIIYEVREPLVIGHRGSLEGVENTIEAIMAAGDMGADYAEIDVLLSKDNVPMVIHDANLFRLSGKSNQVGNLTADELEEIVIKDKKHTGNISRLEDVFNDSKDHIKLLVEFKTHGKEEGSIVKETMKVLEQYDKGKQTIFQTAERPLLKEFNENYPDDKIGYIIIGTLGKLNQRSIKSLDADFLVFEESIVNQSLINTCHVLNVPIFAWTVNNSDKSDELFRMRVDGIITDYPDIMIEVRDEVLNNSNLLE